MKSEKGITLIELLATLSILLIISSLLYGVLIGVKKTQENISNKNSLNQEANLIFSTIKRYHQKENKYEISYNNGSYFISSPTASDQLGNILIYLKIGEVELSDTSKKIEIITSNPGFKSINVTIQLKGQKDKIDTIIKRY
ncbi:hypothetical protein BABA_18287 [Neobacillus bataviensis LMG 21833]|uniref:Prepilin-type N-terminal cleavage/methylation domain-containing protein n=1 Tax=Neobacillus bataviensis LMG 21833 TaxID=1117379 RepID=K6C3Z5_9BACI|nr:prepilin-type N-terminal cleavage/methylation domain-containing protein [Neobacillus bataviensis]EKN65870.1 hypothetical protein BABA_18287 [Neobacillus bataviensis LMG 21833]